MKRYFLFFLLTAWFVLCLLSVGCENQSTNQKPTAEDVVNEPKKVRDAGKSPVTTEVISIADGVYFCRYNSPFNFSNPELEQPECKAYVGTWWTENSATKDCALPFGESFSEVETDLSMIPCAQDSALAFCTNNADYDNVTVTCFYEIDPPPVAGQSGLNLSSTKAGCEGPGGGIFEAGVEVEPAPSGPLLEAAQEACNTTETVSVTPPNLTDEQLAQMRENGGYIYFEPLIHQLRTGVIIYPGGFVDSRAYAPAAQMLANAGIAVAILPVPDYMAISKDAETRPSQVMLDHQEVSQWFIAGHSVGGVAAANYVYKQFMPVHGLIILGSYLSSEHDLIDRQELLVLVAVGSEEASGKEGTESYENFIQGKTYAPPQSTFLIIPGGFHFGFCYQEPPEQTDGPTISVVEQHAVFTQAIIKLVATKLD